MIKSMRLTALFLPVVAIAAMAACEDTTTVTETRFFPAAVIVRLDTQALFIGADTIVRDTLVADTGANALSFTLLRANGDTINTTITGDSLFNVVVTPASGALTYTPQTNLSGILTGNTPGPTSFTFTIRRRNLTVFGPTTVPVLVVEPD